MSLKTSEKDFKLPLYPKRTRRGSVCYDRDWYPYCDVYVVKPKNPYKNKPSSAKIPREKLLKLDRRFKKK